MVLFNLLLNSYKIVQKKDHSKRVTGNWKELKSTLQVIMTVLYKHFAARQKLLFCPTFFLEEKKNKLKEIMWFLVKD